MSFSNYSTFRVSVGAWLDATELTTAQLDDIINMAENRIFRECRTRELETTTTATISSGTVAVPSDYREMKLAYVNSSPIRELERRSAEWILTNYPLRSADGDSIYIARDGSNFIFGPYPSSNDQVVIRYYRNPTAMSGGADTVNSLYQQNEDLYLYASLVQGELFLQRQKRSQTWELMYQNALNRVNNEDKSEYHSGSRLAVKPG